MTTPPQPPEPLTQERLRALACRMRRIGQTRMAMTRVYLSRDLRQAADAIDALAKVVERCEIEEQRPLHPVERRPMHPYDDGAFNNGRVKGVNAERRAILALLPPGAAGQRQE